jgi:prephenate dehydrogenase
MDLKHKRVLITGHPMLGSAIVRDPKFQDQVVAGTRALLAAAP